MIVKHAAMHPPPIPLVVLGGYLGAGKTTLVNHLLTRSQGIRVCILVNDFGAVNIDAALIRQRSSDVISLENGCVCCTIGGKLADALINIANRAEDQERPDLLVVEASGVSDPMRIAQIGLLDRAFRLNGIVVAVDTEAVEDTLANPYVGEICRQQIAAASVLVLTKTDLVDAERLTQVGALIESLASTKLLVPASHGALPMNVFLDATSSARSCNDDMRSLGVSLNQATQKNQKHPGLSSFVFEPRTPFDKHALKQVLRSVGSVLLRAKGIVEIASQPGFHELHFAANRVLLQRLSEQATDETGQTFGRIVLIGLFDEAAKTALQNALHRACMPRVAASQDLVDIEGRER